MGLLEKTLATWGKRSVLFRKAVSTELLSTAGIYMPLSTHHLRVNEQPFKGPQCKTRTCGEATGRREDTEVSSPSRAQPGGQCLPPETESNIS